MSFRKYTYFFIIILSFLFFCQCRFSKEPDKNPEISSFDTLEVKVMTFNIRYGTANDGENHWNKRKNLVFKVFNDYDCDFVGVQEAMVFQINEMIEALPQYSCFSRTRELDPELGEAVPVFFRTNRWALADSGIFWLSDTPDSAGSTSWGNSLPRITTWVKFTEKLTGKTIVLYNTHLDHQSQDSREQSTKLIVDHIAANCNKTDFLILTGDFNAYENNPAIKSLTSSSLDIQDTYRVVYPDEAELGTFNHWRGEKKGSRIDYIFTFNSVTVSSAEIIHDNLSGRYPSDHYPYHTILYKIYP